MKKVVFVLGLLIIVFIGFLNGTFSPKKKSESIELLTTKATIPKQASFVARNLNDEEGFREYFYCIEKGEDTLVFDQNRWPERDKLEIKTWLRSYLSNKDFSSYTLLIRYPNGEEEPFVL